MNCDHNTLWSYYTQLTCGTCTYELFLILAKFSIARDETISFFLFHIIIIIKVYCSKLSFTKYIQFYF